MAKSRPKNIRLNQRRRTRAALVAAATEAVRRGETPTIETAAEAAGVSRATAYRYFTSQQALLLEGSLEAISTLPDPRLVDEGPVEARVDAAIAHLVRMGFNHERVLRTFLMLSMDQWLRTNRDGSSDYPIRKGRRLFWLDRALAPLRSLSPRQKRKLRTALSLLCGIEATIVAEDVCGCTAKEAEEASRWAAQALLRTAVGTSRPSRSDRFSHGSAPPRASKRKARP